MSIATRVGLIWGLMVAAAVLPACRGAAPDTEEAEPAKTSPQQEAARAFLDGFLATDWQRCSTLLHTEALTEFRGVLLPQMKSAVAAGMGEQILSMFEGLDSVEAFEALSPQEFFVRLMTPVTANAPRIREMLAQSRVDVLGEVAEGEDLTHVLYRVSGELQGRKYEQVKVLSVKRDGEAWKPLLLDDIRNLAQGRRR